MKCKIVFRNYDNVFLFGNPLDLLCCVISMPYKIVNNKKQSLNVQYMHILINTKAFICVILNTVLAKKPGHRPMSVSRNN